jgi:hypothetical protein
MNIRVAHLAAIGFALIAFAAFGQTAQARTQTVDHGGTYTGDVFVERGQIVDGDITVFGGDATIEGTVNGDVTVMGGDIYERPGAQITGSKTVLGGDVARSILPWLPNGAGGNAVEQFRISWKVMASALVVLFFLIFPVRVRMALDRLENHPGLSAAIGLVGWVAVIPLAILLCVTVILIPLIAVEAIALIAMIFIGKAALSLLIGRRLYEMVGPRSTPSPLVALILGLVLLTAAELVPVLGWAVTGLVGLVGVGAAILAFVREQSFTGSAPLPPRPPIGGPPMTLSPK